MTKNNPFKCRNECETMIYLDPIITGPMGNMIPLELESDMPHDCPNKKTYNEKFIGDSVMELENKECERWGF